MLRHPGGEKHSRYLIELAFLEAPANGWIWVQVTEKPSACCAA